MVKKRIVVSLLQNSAKESTYFTSEQALDWLWAFSNVDACLQIAS